VTKISEETGVEEKTILQFLREGRLQLREEEDLGLYCQNCKRPIKVGRFCSRCASGIEKELKKGEKVAKRPIDRLTDRDSRMHIYDRLKGH